MDSSGIRCLRSDDFAFMLGLKQIVDIPNGCIPDEIQRLKLLGTAIEHNRKESKSRLDIIKSQFCAVYLPDVVSRYLDPPSLQDITDHEFTRHYQLFNAYFQMILYVDSSPYFIKYLRSNKPFTTPGKRLPSVLAQRLLDLAPHLNLRMRSPTPNRPTDFYQNMTGSCIQLLSTLLVVFVKVPDQNDVVNADVRQGLLVWLAEWSQRYYTTRSDNLVLGELSERVWNQLSPKMDLQHIKRGIKSIRRDLRNLDECALPTCTVRDNCKICAKCKTVSYCSVEHQRAHWNFQIGAPHRELCHETLY